MTLRLMASLGRMPWGTVERHRDRFLSRIAGLLRGYAEITTMLAYRREGRPSPALAGLIQGFRGGTQGQQGFRVLVWTRIGGSLRMLRWAGASGYRGSVGTAATESRTRIDPQPGQDTG